MKIRLGELRQVIAVSLLAEASDEDNDEKDGDEDAGDDGDDLFDDAVDDAVDGEGNSKGKEGAGDGKQRTMPNGSSLDSQVDRQFIGFEKEASGNGIHAEGRSSLLRNMTRRFLLREADEDDDTSRVPADVGNDEGSGSFDPAAFAGMVARLIENFDTVIDVRQTVARRALGFLQMGRKPEEVDAVKAALAEQHGIDTELSDEEREADFQAPPAAGAGPTGA